MAELFPEWKGRCAPLNTAGAALRIKVYPSYAAVEVICHQDGLVIDVTPCKRGIAKDGLHGHNFKFDSEMDPFSPEILMRLIRIGKVEKATMEKLATNFEEVPCLGVLGTYLVRFIAPAFPSINFSTASLNSICSVLLTISAICGWSVKWRLA